MKRRNEVLVGVLTTVALAIVVAGTTWLSRGSFRLGYPLYTVIDWGAGLKKGQKVLLAGVEVGYVDQVSLRREGTVLVSMRIQREFQVPQGSEARVQAAGIFGDVQVALIPEAPNEQSHAPGDTLPAAPPAASTADLVGRADSITISVQNIMRGIETQLIDAQTLLELRNTITNSNRLITQLSVVAAEQSAELAGTMAALRRSVTAMDSAQIGATVRNMQLASMNVVSLTSELQGTTRALNSVVARVDSGSGTVSMLLNDPGLYNDLRGLVMRLDSLTADFMLNPRKYIKISIF